MSGKGRAASDWLQDSKLQKCRDDMDSDGFQRALELQQLYFAAEHLLLAVELMAELTAICDTVDGIGYCMRGNRRLPCKQEQGNGDCQP